MSKHPFPAARIVVLDDHQANVTLLERMLERWGYHNLITTTDSARALEVCLENEPDLVLLDLQMPPPDGFEVMRTLAERNRADSYVPILVLTADVNEEAKARALELGAKDFLSKPFNLTEVRLRVANLLETRRLHLELRDHNATLERRVKERTESLEQAREEVLARLSLAAEYRDDDTNEHAHRVGRTAARLASELNVPQDVVELIRRAAPLHDIGKIAIPDAILLKPGKLTKAEFKQMQTHAQLGADMLAASVSPVLQLAREIALTHHERWDGQGYPAGLAGEEIPLAGRLVALADVFDALTHRRPYKEAMPLEQAVKEIATLSGTHLDPRIVDGFLRVTMMLTETEPMWTMNDCGASARARSRRTRSTSRC